jgi:hypothetical protein
LTALTALLLVGAGGLQTVAMRDSLAAFAAIPATIAFTAFTALCLRLASTPQPRAVVPTPVLSEFHSTLVGYRNADICVDRSRYCRGSANET